MSHSRSGGYVCARKNGNLGLGGTHIFDCNIFAQVIIVFYRATTFLELAEVKVIGKHKQ